MADADFEILETKVAIGCRGKKLYSIVLRYFVRGNCIDT